MSRLMRRDIRELNGYRLVYMPEHPRAMNSEVNHNWGGFVYEHVVVVEKFLGRPMQEDEVTHHLDGNRSNNRIENLLVLYRSQHSKLHQWLQIGAVGLENLIGNGMNSGNTKVVDPTYCESCGLTLQLQQKQFCSPECSFVGRRKVERPTKAQLEKDISSMSFVVLGRKYGVSDNAVRKWAKQYGLVTKSILSQSSGTPEEGAETSGEVKPS